MSKVVKVCNVSKKYLINHQKQEPYTALRDVMAVTISNWCRWLARPRFGPDAGRSREEFWALQDISFEVRQGDRLGIIGRNGAGKSTMLKIISRITEPTAGRVAIKGRVASLLEVGTGFHPELTGRENIFLNGAILGMSRAEINKKFDEIVAFAEVERFLDTPVKRYSSGMYVRLAFAVAAHLEPEILLIDEVLAVGDAKFQKKCLGKMKKVGEEGRTVVFVSHNMPMIASLCNQCVLLDGGRLVCKGPAVDIIQHYYSEGSNIFGEVDYSLNPRRIGDETAHLLKARIINEDGQVISESFIEEPVCIEMIYSVNVYSAQVTPNFHFFTSDGVFAFLTMDAPIDMEAKRKVLPGIYRARCKIPGNFLNDGTYYVGFALTTLQTSKVHFYEKDLLSFTVVDPIDVSATRGQYTGPIPGAVRPVLEWECEMIS
ncbi:ABC transporter ATP-binding protein [Pelotomaculum propionicicum]|uniref:Teichoic acids export ATP-binding protein TagH n=1 Tax=Pelotomaculum propionicicum TaxID=258475 RepID=A0A4Y7RMY9_9FIRM|nr:ABC transporter ATP-binding protein [Pelotomaculum propionicicum]TEB10358.1 Teichoic acids export ATP-binding protein TagH [Pelotomaculum propionicicum]